MKGLQMFGACIVVVFFFAFLWLCHTDVITLSRSGGKELTIGCILLVLALMGLYHLYIWSLHSKMAAEWMFFFGVLGMIHVVCYSFFHIVGIIGPHNLDGFNEFLYSIVFQIVVFIFGYSLAVKGNKAYHKL